MIKKGLISVIIPLYNSEQHIEKILEMLDKQTFKEFEVIFINDGSTDNTRVKLEKLGNKDNIVIYNKSNGGPSSTRNFGLGKASGEFIVFIDDDDIIEPHYLEVLYKNIQDVDLVVSSYKTTQINNVKINSPTKNKKEIIEKSEFIKRFADLKGNFVYHPLWNKIYKRQIIEENNVKFDNKISIGEDFIFNIDYLKNANKICLINDILYNYVTVDRTSLTQKYRENLWNEEKEEYKHYKDFFVNLNEYENYAKEIEIFLIYSFNSVISHLFNTNRLTKEQIKQKIKQVINDKNLQYSVRNSKANNLYIKFVKKLIKIKNIGLIYYTYKIKYILKRFLKKY